MDCDVLVVGASNDNLLMALELINSGKKVIIVDSLKRSIELENNYLMGRYEFSDDYEYLYGNQIKNLFNEYNITKNEDYEEYTYNTNLVTYKENYEFQINSNADDFISQVDKHFSNSKNLDKLFIYADECFRATNLELKNMEVREEDFPNYYKYKDESYKSVLDKLHINRTIQNLLETLTELPFAVPFHDFATTLHATIVEKKYKLNRSNAFIYYKLREKLANKGCNIKYDTRVLEIEVEDGSVVGAILSNGLSLNCSSIVYGKMPSTLLPLLESSRIINEKDYSKIINTQKLKVFLGLMKPLESIGLKKGKYVIKSNDSHAIDNVNQTIYLNNFSDRSIISVECDYKNNCWNSYLDSEDYYYKCGKTANELIGCFEDLTNNDILDYVEEVKIISPVDYAYKYETKYGETFEDVGPSLKKKLLSIDGLYVTNLYLEYDYLFNSKYLINLMLAKQIIGGTDDEEE